MMFGKVPNPKYQIISVSMSPLVHIMVVYLAPSHYLRQKAVKSRASWFLCLSTKCIWKCLLWCVGLNVLSWGLFSCSLWLCVVHRSRGIHISHSSRPCGMISLRDPQLISAFQLGRLSQLDISNMGILRWDARNSEAPWAHNWVPFCSQSNVHFDMIFYACTLEI